MDETRGLTVITVADIMRIVGIVLVVVIALYGLGGAAMALLQRQLMYPGAYLSELREPLATPAGLEATTLQTPDGETLHALWAKPAPGCGTIVSFHGNGSRPEWHAERFVGAPWKPRGWGVLAIAYRGYAGSTGTPTEDGLIEDGLAAYAFVRAHAPGSPILLHGHSLGTAIAVAVAEREPHLGLYLEAPFDSMSHVARLLYPVLPTGLFLKDTYRSDLRIAGSAEPVLIVHGDQDDIVPSELGAALAKAAGPRARIAIIPGDHVSVVGARDGEAEPFFRSRIGESCKATAP